MLLGISHRFPSQAHRKTDRVLRQLEAGGAVARAALRKLLLSRMTLEERVAKVREAIVFWRLFFSVQKGHGVMALVRLDCILHNHDTHET